MPLRLGGFNAAVGNGNSTDKMLRMELQEN